MAYLVVENTPGYMPDSEPEKYDDWNQAVEAASIRSEEICDNYREETIARDGVAELYHVSTEIHPESGWACWTVSFNEPHRLDRVVEITEVPFEEAT